MTPEELAREQEQADRDRAWQLFDARAKQLLGDVGMGGVRHRKNAIERCRKTWPKLSDDEVEATVDRAKELADELLARKAEEQANRQADKEAQRMKPFYGRSNPERQQTYETPLAGRRLEGDELERAKQTMTTTKAMTNEDALAYTIASLKQRTLARGVATEIHRELQEKGYEPTYSAFFRNILEKAKAQLAAEKTPSAAPSEGTAEPDRTPDSEPPAGVPHVLAPMATIASEAPVSFSGNGSSYSFGEAREPALEIDSLHANLVSGRADDEDDYCEISLVVSGPPAFINRLGDVVAAIRGVAA